MKIVKVNTYIINIWSRNKKRYFQLPTFIWYAGTFGCKFSCSAPNLEETVTPQTPEATLEVLYATSKQAVGETPVIIDERLILRLTGNFAGLSGNHVWFLVLVKYLMSYLCNLAQFLHFKCLLLFETHRMKTCMFSVKTAKAQFRMCISTNDAGV